MLHGRPFLHSFHSLGVPDVAHIKQLDTIRYVPALGNTLTAVQIYFQQFDVSHRCALIPPEAWRRGVVKTWESKHLKDQLHPQWTGP